MSMMDKQEIDRLNQLLAAHIPLAVASQASILSLDANHLCLWAPLSVNQNDKGTAFGGALASLGTLSGWALTTSQLLQALPSQPESKNHDVFIRKSELHYRKPIPGDFALYAFWPQHQSERFYRQLYSRKMAKAELCIYAVAASKAQAYELFSEREDQMNQQAAFVLFGEYVAKLLTK